MTITSPFTAHSTAREVIAGHDLSRKTVLVTGASSGLGIETVRAFLLAGASVVLAVRDPAKGERAAQQLRTETNNERVHVLTLDLGSLTSIRQAAEQFRVHWSRLDLLINNAGIMAVPLGYTPDGFEFHFGTNYLGHYLLTRLLLPVLRVAAPARVVVLSSSGHRFSDIHFDDINYRTRPYDKWEAYGQSKTACALFAVGLTRHAGSQGIFANAVNPGAIRTGLQQHLSSEDLQAMGWTDAQGHWLDPQIWKSPEQGVATSVWAAVGQELEGVGGLYLENCQEATPRDPTQSSRGSGYLPYALDPEHAERLWTLSQEWVGLEQR
ncbi:MAG: SDR family NAD(P)-dependent oxidoreductase [Chloroflexi bacterium]|nr:SDR family NAD(P)-dependent oxidoreductase [Chloroflexota bacterium]